MNSWGKSLSATLKANENPRRSLLFSFRGPLQPMAQESLEDTFPLENWLWKAAQKDALSWGSGRFTILAKGENKRKIWMITPANFNYCNQSGSMNPVLCIVDEFLENLRPPALI